MKFLLLFVLFSFNALSSECSVYGISDSPQKMNCYIHQLSEFKPLNLVCKDGVYNILWKDKRYEVEQAFHEEVETGSSPLVFQAGSLTLKTVSLHIYAQAKLLLNKRSYAGICFLN